MRLGAAALLVGALFCGAELRAAPLLVQFDMAQSVSPVEQAKVICEENGLCYSPSPRRPVARWVYGDTNFNGPYAGPGYYGNPRYRFKWWPFWWW